jgi:anti-repressor protein
MSNEIQRFDFKGESLRALTNMAGEPWFVAKDVCDVLELSNVSAKHWHAASMTTRKVSSL